MKRVFQEGEVVTVVRGLLRDQARRELKVPLALVRRSSGDLGKENFSGLVRAKVRIQTAEV